MASNSTLKHWLLGEQEEAADGNANAHEAPPWLPRILLLDGGVSTHLEDSVGTEKPFAHRELWSSSLLLTAAGQQQILAGHQDWLRAVNLISTVTYQCHFAARYWPPGQVIANEAHMEDLWRVGVQLAQQAVTSQHEASSSSRTTTTDNHRYHGVVASSGCFGAALANGAEYTGDYPGATVVDLRDFHARKLEVIQNIVPAVDAMAIETIPSLEECQALRDLFTSREEGSLLWKDAPMGCWISLACRNGRELNDGTPVAQALQVLAGIPRSAVQAFGFNCGHGRDLCSLLAILLAHYYEDDSNTHKPRGIVLYPNAGEDWNAATADWVEGTGCTHPADLAHVLMACIRQIETSSAKANTAIPRIVVGGCCRTTPAAMASLRAQVDQHLQETG